MEIPCPVSGPGYFQRGQGEKKKDFKQEAFLLRRIVPPKPTTERGLNFFLTFPSSQQFVLARNVGTGKWYHLCHSFITILMRILSYQDGLKIFGFNLPDEGEFPLSSDFFKYLQFGYNFRGMITDVQIFSIFQYQLVVRTKKGKSLVGTQ